MDKIYQRIPQHIGIIPDGNRRWAERNGMDKRDGYKYGIEPGLHLYEMCLELGVKEITFYGFTKDNTKRPPDQTKEFQKACVDSVIELSKRDAELLVVGDESSNLFPKELVEYRKRTKFGKGLIKVNFLVNYGWNWDLGFANKMSKESELVKNIASSEISRMDMIIRWGGRFRLSGFLPVQSIYADVFVLDDMWPDFKREHVYKALAWYQEQDVTLGG
jgi:undecaprenyl diphosphate synthase